MRTVKKRSQLQELSVANSLNGKTVVASGAMWNAKGDVRNDEFLVECKTTKNYHYTLRSTTWEKIQFEARKDRMRIPLLIVDLEDSDRYVIFNPRDFLSDVREFDTPKINSGKQKISTRLYGNPEAFRDGNIVTEHITLKNTKGGYHYLYKMSFSDFEKEYLRSDKF